MLVIDVAVSLSVRYLVHIQDKQRGLRLVYARRNIDRSTGYLPRIFIRGEELCDTRQEALVEKDIWFDMRAMYRVRLILEI